MTRWYRTGVSHGRHQRECSDVHDHADLVAPIALYDARLVKSRGLHDGSRPVATRIELLTVDHAVGDRVAHPEDRDAVGDRKSTRLNSSHGYISYAVFCLKKKKKHIR